MTTDEILNKVANHRQKQRELEEEWGQLREQALQECLRLIEPLNSVHLNSTSARMAVKPNP